MFSLRALGVTVALIAVLLAVFEHQVKQTPTYPSFKEREPSLFRRSATPPESAPEGPKTAYVTGANGFLGGHLVEQLALGGWQVTAVYRKGSKNATLSMLAERYKPLITVLHADVLDRASLEATMPEGVGAVFHVAAALGFWYGARDLNYRTNVLGTRNMVDVALQKNAVKFVHTSSVSVFWPATHMPLTDESPRAALDDWNSYANTKALAELEILAGIQEGLWAVMLNPAGIIGKYDATSFGQIPRRLKEGSIPAMGPGGVATCSAAEVAKAHVRAAEVGRLGHRYVLAGPYIDWSEFMAITGAIMGIDTSTIWTVPPWVLRWLGVFYDVASIALNRELELSSEVASMMVENAVFDSSKAERELQYNASVPPESLIRENIEWLKEQKFI